MLGEGRVPSALALKPLSTAAAAEPRPPPLPSSLSAIFSPAAPGLRLSRYLRPCAPVTLGVRQARARLTAPGAASAGAPGPRSPAAAFPHRPQPILTARRRQR